MAELTQAQLDYHERRRQERSADRARMAEAVPDEAPPVLVHAGDAMPVASVAQSAAASQALPVLDGTDDAPLALPTYERFQYTGLQPLSPAELATVTLWCHDHCEASRPDEPRSPFQCRWDQATTNAEKRLLAATVVRDLRDHGVLQFLEKQYSYAAAAPNQGGQEAAQILRNLNWAKDFLATYG